jgi:hypothetical protein
MRHTPAALLGFQSSSSSYSSCKVKQSKYHMETETESRILDIHSVLRPIVTYAAMVCWPILKTRKADLSNCKG